MRLVLIESEMSQMPEPPPTVCKTEQKAVDFIQAFLDGLKLDYSDIDFQDDWVEQVNDLLYGSSYRLRLVDNVSILV